jgi:predicted dehydrogenase
MADQVKWGIIGAGSIAGAFAGGIKGSNTGRLLAVGSRALKKAQKFAKANGAERAYGSYEELLADKDVEVVYVATPHPVHAEWAIGAAEAGKHVLSEKPAGLNYAEAAMMVEAAARNDVFFMEAFMYRCHPQIRKVADLVRDGAIGRVEWIDAAFGFDAGEGPEGRLFENDLGGGGILDVGCYAVSFSRLIAGVAQGREFADPIDVKAVGVLGQTGVDAYTSAVLKFEGDIIAEVQTAVSASMPCDARVYGSEGHIIIPKPWIPNGDGPGSTEIKLCKGEREKTIKVKTDRGLYSLEADEVAEHLDQRQASWPAMRWADTLGNMKTLDRWREEIGLTYEREKLENHLRHCPGVRRRRAIPGEMDQRSRRA